VKKVLILCAHRPGRSPSQRYRFEQYLPALEKQGFKFTFSYLLNEKDDRTFYSKGNILSKMWILLKSVSIRLLDCRRLKDFDIIFIQREATFFGTSFFEKKAFQSGANVIFDFDDSIWLADTSPGNQKWEWIKKPEKFYKNLQYAHTVIAGNGYLAGKARPHNKNVVVIPTTIDTEIHVPKPELRNKSILFIGWSGSISTIKHFEMVLPALKKLKQKYGPRIGFKVLGPAGYADADLGIKSKKWSAETEVEELNSFDIGIMPLPDDEWSKGKCGLKGLSYMACGVATVMSPVGVNSEIIRSGINGFFAANEDEWYKTLSQLIEDLDLRQQIGVQGRKTVEEKFSVTRYLPVYETVFFGATKKDDPVT
jgi:glycosyltransferase involved in cell wall biosynthesis